MPLDLLSPWFLGTALAAIVALSTFRGVPRQFVFLALNLLFVGGFLLGPRGALTTVVFALLGWGLLLVSDSRAKLIASVVAYIALFIYVRGYDLIAWVLPESYLFRAVSTIGLSFLFFKVVHVILDRHAGTIGRLDLLTYLNYCLNFTTFVMGPIQRYQDYREQWDGEKHAIPLTVEAHLDAVLRVLAGLAKVYILAAFLEARAFKVDTDLSSLSLAGLIVQAYCFWFYLYLNFSGYCDVVIGIGSMLGIRPPENFNKPFLARNISDFWQRQHRSLTLWLTDYVFNPTYKTLLTRSKRRAVAAYAALVLTMVVSGLWHGTTLSFLLFGVVHGLWFVVYRAWDDVLTRRLGRTGVQKFRANPLVHAAGIVLTFNATAAAFVFFRASPQSVVDTLSRLLSV